MECLRATLRDLLPWRSTDGSGSVCQHWTCTEYAREASTQTLQQSLGVHLARWLIATGVLEWGGRLFALHESGLPYEMDPADLSTLGETDIAGSIEGKGPFAAHYRIMHQPDGTRR